MRTILRALAGSLAVLLAAGALALLGGASPAAALDGPGITGRVVDADTGAGIADATVMAFCLEEGYWAPCYDDRWNDIAAKTATDGSYDLPLAAGTYRLWVRPASSDYPDAVFGSDAERPNDGGTDLVVVGGPLTADFELVANSVITGTVTGAGVGPLAGIRLEARTYSEQGGWLDNVIGAGKTKSDGTYELRVPADTYRIVFNTSDRSGGEGSPGLRNESVRWETETYAEQVIVRGTTVTGVDRELAEAPHGTVTGHVERTSGEPLDGITVTAYTLQDGEYWEDRPSHRVVTDQSGDYVLYVPTGDYRFGFSQVNYDDLTEPATVRPVYYDAAATVDAGRTISVGLSETSGINAVMSAYGQITGRVTAADGTPIENAYASAWSFNDESQEWERARGASTAADGTYRLNLAEGTYKVGFEAAEQGFLGEYYDDVATREQAADVVVGPETTSGIDAALSMGETISGTVTNEAGDPLDDIRVILYQPSGDWSAVTDVSTDDSGRFAFRGLKPGGTYRVAFSGTGWTKEFYSDAASIDEATDVIAGEAGPVTAALAPSTGGGSIIGTVTDEAGQPVAGVSIDVYRADQWSWIGSATSGEDGTYSFPGLKAGQYEVNFNVDGDYLYAEERYKYVDVVDGAPATADLRVSTGGLISGVLTGADGEPIGDGYVEVYTADTEDYVRSGYTDYSDGSYKIRGVPAGTYRLRFASNDGHRSEWFSDKSSFEGADDVVVDVRETSTADAELSAGATVAGRVTLADGSPVEWGEVQVQQFFDDAAGGEWGMVTYAFTDSDGHYSSPALEPGTYRVAIDLWDDVHLPAHSDEFTIAADDSGAVTRNLVIEEKQPPAITSLAPPVVSGAALVGETLTATGGDWDVDGVSVSYQWQRDGEPIEGAVETTYAIGEADAGHVLSVLVTAEKTGYVSGSAASEATDVVSHGPLVNAQAPIVSGTPQVGETLTAYPGVWNADGATFTFQWLRDGARIAGATEETYALGADDLNAKISVEVTAIKSTWEHGEAVSAPSGVVVEGVFPAVDAPVISGNVWITETVRAEFTAPDGADVAYSWQIRQKETGQSTPVYEEVGTDRSLELLGAWKNSSLRLVVTLTKPGYTTATYVVLVEDPLH
ncbi:carboxypeptidase regulatory-like domain-containing protein [Nocardioides sp. NPDC006303]|uniref:carboxypeptidase regulatory-like domain-containing protein n=1 Tax=Nocardioides sp. NPDC006303 TaxID=3156747 RepID=UPI0033A65E32